MNRLSLETSPYLLQHAQNPVHWQAWNMQTRQRAKAAGQLLIISSGYAACHWCHVMEHECFEDVQVAKIMNEHFTCIKVDREEHPDVDALYMKAIQIMTNQGGWPLNVVCLPDGRPIWGGTYFKKDDWIEALTQLATMFSRQPEKMVDYAKKLHQGIQTISLIDPVADHAIPSLALVEPLMSQWKKSFDHDYGGYARAPKFMLPNNFRFLLRYGHGTQDKALLDFVFLTLDRMAWGGIFDVLAGGFSRYSVDMRWHIPHFEKMLYDNGQMLSLYADAYKLTKNAHYAEIIDKTLLFIESLSDENGGFYCAFDADSRNTAGTLEEGAYYVWSREELQRILGLDFVLFSQIFNVNDFGLWEHNKYVLIQSEPLEYFAASTGLSEAELTEKKKQWETILLAHRKRRQPPELDNKQVTAWNAIMLNGLVDAYKATENNKYFELAIKTADFITRDMWAAEGYLYRHCTKGKKAIAGYLDDYAFTIEAFINLYTATFDMRLLLQAKQLADYCLDAFFDTKTGYFWLTAHGGDLLAPHYEIEDNVIPSANSVMAKNLRKLSAYFHQSYYEQIAAKMIAGIVKKIDYPSAFSNWLDALLDFNTKNLEVTICGLEATEKARSVNKIYLPDMLLAGSRQPSTLPQLKQRFVEDQTLFYVCLNKTCLPPEKTVENAIKVIQLHDSKHY